MADPAEGAGQDERVSDFRIGEKPMGALPKGVVAVHVLVIVLKAVTEFDQEAFARTEARPVEMAIHRVLIERLLDRCRKARHVAPEPDRHASIASDILCGGDPDRLALAWVEPAAGRLIDGLEKLLSRGEKCRGAQPIYDV